MRDSIKTKCSNKDFIDISNLIIKSKEKEFKITKKHQIKSLNFLQKSPGGAIPTTAWTQVYSKLSQGASYWVHCSY